MEKQESYIERVDVKDAFEPREGQGEALRPPAGMRTKPPVLHIGAVTIVSAPTRADTRRPACSRRFVCISFLSWEEAPLLTHFTEENAEARRTGTGICQAHDLQGLSPAMPSEAGASSTPCADGHTEGQRGGAVCLRSQGCSRQWGPGPGPLA